MQKINKFLDFEIKAVPEEPRTYWFTASTETRDRMGDVIVQSGWRLADFKKNPVILWAHRYAEPPIGKAIETVVEGGRLRLKIQFVAAETYAFAGMIEQMVKDKFIVAGSVGFSVYKMEDLTEDDKKVRPEMAWGKRLFGDLLEFSMVPVPANQEALSDKRFADLVLRSFGAPSAPVEKESPLLPCKNEQGAIDPRKLTASFGALFGARGGVPVPEADRKACHLHLSRMATEAGIEPWEFREYTPEELRERCADVWHDELIDIVTDGMDDEGAAIAKSYLVKGQRRAEMKATVASLQKLLDATEDEPQDVADPNEAAATRLEAALTRLNDNLSKVAAA
jgi:hypothetical protein